MNKLFADVAEYLFIQQIISSGQTQITPMKPNASPTLNSAADPPDAAALSARRRRIVGFCMPAARGRWRATRIKRGVGPGRLRRNLLRRERLGQGSRAEAHPPEFGRRTPRHPAVLEFEASESAQPVRHPPGRQRRHLGGDGIRRRPLAARRDRRPAERNAARRSARLDSRHRRRPWPICTITASSTAT